MLFRIDTLKQAMNKYNPEDKNKEPKLSEKIANGTVTEVDIPSAEEIMPVLKSIQERKNSKP